MPNQYWLIFFIIWTTLVFGSGMFTEHKFNLATIEKLQEKEVTKAQEGQNNIVKFHQDLQKASKTNENDKCLNAPIPADIRKLLH